MCILLKRLFVLAKICVSSSFPRSRDDLICVTDASVCEDLDRVSHAACGKEGKIGDVDGH